jgi:hypothetical protein
VNSSIKAMNRIPRMKMFLAGDFTYQHKTGY